MASSHTSTPANPASRIASKVRAVNAPGSEVRAVLGTEVASQGLDFKGVREMHVLEPWYNMSRVHQVVGRAVRRCSHVHLPPDRRNVTVSIHCLTRGGGADREETVDEKCLRFAATKQSLIDRVADALRAASLDCDLYHAPAGGAPVAQVIASGRRVPSSAVQRTRASVGACAMPWRVPRKPDMSTFHPFAYRQLVDMCAWDVRGALLRRQALTYDEIREELGPAANDLTLSLALDMLLDDFRNGRWLAPMKMLYVGNMYVLLPEAMQDRVFTMEEARRGETLRTDMHLRV
jgi:hypothetical protein